MRPATFDVTAGRRAVLIRRSPSTPQPVSDPMDPRWGMLEDEAEEWIPAPRLIFDPTDPACEEPAA